MNTLRSLRLIVLTALAAAVLPAGSALAGTITITTGAPTTTISSFGYPNTASYGQTILGNGHVLLSFTFTFTLPATVNFKPAVYTWTGDRAGTQVWLGTTTAPCGCGQQTMTFTPGVVLQSGQEYVLLMTTADESTGSSTGNFGSTTDDSPYPDGQFVFQNGGAGAGLATLPATAWSHIAKDLAFTLVFSSNDQRVMVCTTAAHDRVGGTPGTFFDVTAEEWEAGLTDTTSIFYKSTPAIFVQGYGVTCLLSDVVTYGGTPSAYADAGYKVNAVGDKAPPGFSDADWGAIYQYYLKK